MKFECKVRSRRSPEDIEVIAVEAEDQEQAMSKLQRDGYLVVSIKSNESPLSLNQQMDRMGLNKGCYAKLDRMLAFGKPVSTRELIFFAVQLSTLLKAGVALLRALQILERGMANPRFRDIVGQMAVTISGGRTLADALGQNSSVFPWMWKSLVEVGEMSGTLPQVLQEIAHYQESAERIKGKVISALVYPSVILVVAFAAVTFLMISIIPKFAAIFESQNMALPMLTQVVVNCSNLIRNQFIFVAAAIAGIIILIRFALKTPHGKIFFHEALLKMPLMGEIVMQVIVVRFSRGMSTLIKAGIPLLGGLKTSAALVGNAYVETRLLEVHQSVTQGHGLGEQLENKKVFPVFMTQLVSVGEETGEVESFLTLLANYYEEQVDQFLQRVSVIIEPIILVVLAVIIGIIVIAVFMPIINMSTGSMG